MADVLLLYIDSTSHNDYDKVIRYLHEHNVEITDRNKAKMVIAAKTSYELINQMQDEVNFDDALSVGTTPLP